MVAQVVAILALILGHGHQAWFMLLGQAALWVVVVAALVSAADYFRRFNLILSPRAADFTVALERRDDRKAVEPIVRSVRLQADPPRSA